MSLSNQIYNQLTPYTNAPVFYNDQVLYQVFIMAPVSVGGPEDNFTFQLQFRKVGTLILIEGLSTSNPVGGTVSVITRFDSTTLLREDLRPTNSLAIPWTMSGLSGVGGHQVKYIGVLAIASTGAIGFAASGVTTFPIATNTSPCSGHYSLV